MRHIFILIIFSIASVGFSQQYQPYNWEDKRNPEKLNKNQSNSEISILNKHQYQFVYEDQKLVLYSTEHSIVKVNNDKAVSSNNRIYIPLENTIEIMDVKARTLGPDGKTVELDKNEIKEVEDKDGGKGYKIFAIEGAEVGDEIEFFHTRKMKPLNFGREYAQFNNPTNKFQFTLSCPANLRYDVKSYNGLPEIEVTNTEDYNKYNITAKNIPELTNEPFSNYNSERMRVEFILAFNTYGDGSKIYTWEKIGKNTYSAITEREKSEEKAVRKLLKKLNMPTTSSEYEKAAYIEDYLKKNYFYEENAGPESSKLDFIIKNKFSNKLGLSRLTVALLNEFNLQYELVVTPDRSVMEIDLDFETYNYLSDYLIYLPKSNKYLTPHDMSVRLDMVPAQHTATNAIFIKETKIRDYVIPVVETRYIEAPSADLNRDDMEVVVDFQEDLSGNKINLKRKFTGYQSSFIKSILPIIEEKQKEELLKNLVKFMTTDADIQTMEFQESEFDYTNWTTPLEISSTFTSKAFLDKAGPTLLLKVGELIGPQSELYQEEDRKLKVVNEFNRKYDRKITINLPPQYEPQNLEDLNIDEVVKNIEGNEIFKFKSTYEINQNQLIIQIDEFYEKIHYPKEEFEAFQKVINAAADFNKIVLVLKKK
ncbi:hypothetical protein MATR_22240 [Marivirga tractuosa]|uniref:DUF3857 domain-containing protein n=1 Tax=Marivirga tractuosa (strain ATCC 23168 / DSM 4126 / NBRC 15989 / NCIMB 1408 / VKM B-1430 / H-43) TaxID=643867 RepID=E4TKI0_MARTH|nr:DUF3857 domain-containing protein [Marivirga tractuosa]ADR20160.1 hypothetical protein Ftrac_0149 [Marivirga tractuosa DSM 4126]BDD15399.1 hypothetical protein MATR_22240 [Marivirga tractuosa]